MKKAYIDIETNYVGAHTDQLLFQDHINHKLTVVGILVKDNWEKKLVQLIGDQCTGENILEALDGVELLVSYNGRSAKDAKGRTGFDCPVICAQTGIQLEDYFDHLDLVLECWKHKLFGGLKKIEVQLGIPRTTKGVDGMVAIQLWKEYSSTGSQSALELLKRYNAEDVYNLEILEHRLKDYTPGLRRY